MFKNHTRLMAAAGAVATAGVIATTGVMAAAAAAHPARAATSGAESFQIMTTSATGAPSVITSGVFTAAGADHENQQANTATFVFSNGTVSLKHSPGKGTQSMNPKTCLLTVNQHGTYTLTGGTGAYSGVTGNGTYKLSILAVAARSGGKCSQSKPPLAFHQVINATGTASLP
jgi:hypothetical protein